MPDMTRIGLAIAWLLCGFLVARHAGRRSPDLLAGYEGALALTLIALVFWPGVLLATVVGFLLAMSLRFWSWSLRSRP